MKRSQLVELLQCIRSAQAEPRLIVAGSQALYASTNVAPAVVEFSIEADLLLVREAFQARAEIESRLVPFGGNEGLINVWALEIHDLLASKLMAGRDKDFAFLRALLDHSLCDFHTLLARVDLLRTGPSANAVPDRLAKLKRQLRDWCRDDLAQLVQSETHH